MTKKYSVVIPAYNAGKFLSECLESVFSQSTSPFEVICVDDGSVDDTCDVVRQYPAVQLICQQNQGCSAARNAALRVISSEFVAFCDADDIWLPNKMTMQLKLFQNDIAASYCATEEFISELTNMSGARSPRNYCLPLTSCVVIRRTLFDEIGYFDEKLLDTEFIQWWSRVLAAGVSVAVANEVLVRRRIHANNKSRKSYRSPEEFLALVRHHRQRMSHISP